MVLGGDLGDDLLLRDYLMYDDVMESKLFLWAPLRPLFSRRIFVLLLLWGALVLREPIFNFVNDFLYCKKS